MAYVSASGDPEDFTRYPLALNYPDATWVRVFNRVEEDYVKSLKLETGKGCDMDTWRQQQLNKAETLPPKKEDYRTPLQPEPPQVEDTTVDDVLKDLDKAHEYTPPKIEVAPHVYTPGQSTGPKIKRR